MSFKYNMCRIFARIVGKLKFAHETCKSITSSWTQFAEGSKFAAFVHYNGTMQICLKFWSVLCVLLGNFKTKEKFI